MPRPMRRLLPGTVVGETEIVAQRGKLYLVRCRLCGKERLVMRNTAWRGGRCWDCYLRDETARAKRNQWCWRKAGAK